MGSLLWAAALGAAALLAGCADHSRDPGRFVSLYPSAAIVELPGQSTSMAVMVRNISEKELTSLRLEVKSEALQSAVVEPRAITRIIPGDRRAFAVTLKRKAKQPKARYPLAITLYSPDLPQPAGLDLIVDLAIPTGQNWIDVGQVKLVSAGSSRTVYFLLAGVPVLVLLGWLLWRWSRSRNRA